MFDDFDESISNERNFWAFCFPGFRQAGSILGPGEQWADPYKERGERKGVNKRLGIGPLPFPRPNVSP